MAWDSSDLREPRPGRWQIHAEILAEMRLPVNWHMQANSNTSKEAQSDGELSTLVVPTLVNRGHKKAILCFESGATQDSPNKLVLLGLGLGTHLKIF